MNIVMAAILALQVKEGLAFHAILLVSLMADLLAPLPLIQVVQRIPLMALIMVKQPEFFIAVIFIKKEQVYLQLNRLIPFYTAPISMKGF